MDTCEPRTARISESESGTKLRPLRRTSPPTIFPGGLTRREMDIAVTLFPQPLSPTRPSVFPFSTRNETSSTALTTPASVKKWVLRFFTSKTAVKSSAPPDIRHEPYERRPRFHLPCNMLRQLRQ